MSVYRKLLKLAEATGTELVNPHAFSPYCFQLPNGRLIMSHPDRDGHATEVSFLLGYGIKQPLEERLCNGITASTRARFHNTFQELSLLVGALEQALDFCTGLEVEREVLPDGTEKYTITKTCFPADAEMPTVTVVTEFGHDGYHLS